MADISSPNAVLRNIVIARLKTLEAEHAECSSRLEEYYSRSRVHSSKVKKAKEAVQQATLTLSDLLGDEHTTLIAELNEAQRASFNLSQERRVLENHLRTMDQGPGEKPGPETRSAL